MLDPYYDMLKNTFSVKGCTSRHYYWAGILTWLIILVVLFWFGEKISFLSFLPALFTIVMIVPTLTATVRRLHDTKKSTWWMLLLLLPVIGWVLLFIMLVLE